jgi:hypothetical protein
MLPTVLPAAPQGSSPSSTYEAVSGDASVYPALLNRLDRRGESNEVIVRPHALGAASTVGNSAAIDGRFDFRADLNLGLYHVPGMSHAAKLTFATATILSALTVFAVHHQQVQEREVKLRFTRCKVGSWGYRLTSTARTCT